MISTRLFTVFSQWIQMYIINPRWRQCARRAVWCFTFSVLPWCLCATYLWSNSLNLWPLNHKTPDLKWKPENFPPLPTDISDYIRRLPFTLPYRKHLPTWGKRGYIHVCIKAYLNSHEVINHHALMDILPSSPALWDHSSFRLFCHDQICPGGLHAHLDLPFELHLFRVGCGPSRVVDTRWGANLHASS